MKKITDITSTAFALFALACLGLLPPALAVSPSPDGGYPDGNTAEGTDALFTLTTGANNTAIGFDALYHTDNTDDNTAIGWQALFNNTIGGSNTSIGAHALGANTVGAYNTATGAQALLQNTDGRGNTANGYVALYANSSGRYNTALGNQSLSSNTIGIENTGTGYGALYNNTAGSHNTADGFDALYSLTTGSFNIALGYAAGSRLSSGDNNIDIGNSGTRRESDTIRIGKRQNTTYIAGISGATVAGGVGVIIDSSGHLGTVVSAKRYKEAIEPMDKASEAIFALKPVTFRYKRDLDPAGIAQFGLVAEDAEKVNPDLVARDEEGHAYTVRYEAVNAMLLNEFLKQHREVQAQRAIIEQQQKQIEMLTAGLQKVGAQLEVNKRASQTVVNNETAMR